MKIAVKKAMNFTRSVYLSVGLLVRLASQPLWARITFRRHVTVGPIMEREEVKLAAFGSNEK